MDRACDVMFHWSSACRSIRRPTPTRPSFSPVRPTIRVCGSSINRGVDVIEKHPEPLRNVLENLATQVGGSLVFTAVSTP